MYYRVLASLLVVTAACADPPVDAASPASTPEVVDEEGESPPVSSSSIRFRLPETGVPAWGDVPFPGESYRNRAGEVAIGEFPNPKQDRPVFDSIRELLRFRSGFCTTCNITFLIDGPLDEQSLSGNVHLVDVDPDSEAFGRELPLQMQFDAATGRLAVRPASGTVLAPGRTYAAVVTRSVRGGDGHELAPAEHLVEVLEGSRDIPLFAEGLTALESVGIHEDQIAGLTVFKTDDPTSQLRELARTVRASRAPVASVDRVWTGAAIDELLGVPADDRAGVDRPQADGTAGSAAVRHETTGWVVTGTFNAPSFIAGEGSAVGVLARSADGKPEVVGEVEVPYLLIVPAEANLANLPVVVVHHGFSASRTTGFALADTAGRAGFAVLAIDAYEHGERAPGARDRVHAMRGTLEGADGFAETNKLTVTSRVFGFSGVPPELALSPHYALSAFTQFAADALSTVRLVTEGELAALHSQPGLSGLRFDEERVVFVGNSMGAVVGVSVAAVEPDVRTTVLNVMPGSIVSTLVESGEFRPLSEQVLLPAIGVVDEFDGVERSMVFDPTVDLFRWAIEPVDPLALSGALGRSSTDVLIQLATHDEVAAPRPSQAVVDAAGLRDVTYYAGAMHGMLEVNEQVSRWAEPLVPPLRERPAPVTVTNPTDDVHDEIEALLTRVAGGQP